MSPFPIKPVSNSAHDPLGNSGILNHLVGKDGVSKLSTSSCKSVVVLEDKRTYFVLDNCSLSAT